MGKTRRPLIIAIILFTATLTLVGATFAAASLPSSGGLAAKWDNTRQASTPMPSTSAQALKRPVVTAEPKSTPSTAEPSPTAGEAAKSKKSAKGPITYVVKRGDTLSIIAAWFRQHGYRDLYNANKKIIGSDPDRIFPGQRITISSNGKMTMERSS